VYPVNRGKTATYLETQTRADAGPIPVTVRTTGILIPFPLLVIIVAIVPSTLALAIPTHITSKMV
jgi:hypothetical protein